MNPFLRRLFARPRTVTRPTPKAPRRAVLRLSTLEDRATPATFTVTSAGDTGTGVGLTGDLRYCISQANASPGGDTIVFDQTPGGVFGGFVSAQTINLTSALPTITDDLTVTGPGLVQPLIDPTTWKLTVTRPGVTPFGILTVGPAVTVNLSQFKISRGNATNGGGIGVPNAAGTTLNLTSMEVSGNSAVGTDPANPAPGAGGGGGIFMDGTGTLTTDFTTIGSNGAFEGGGLLLRGGMTATFRHTTISNNVANGTGSDGGGGLYATDTSGGGILVVDSTIASNTAGDSGGGVLLDGWGGRLDVRNSTIAGNGANSTTIGRGGGGIANFGGGVIALYSSIMQNNAATVGGTFQPRDILSGGVIEEAFSAVFDTNLGGGNVLVNPQPYQGTITGGNLNATNPQLGPLKYNGGPTFTVAPGAGSPVIGKGDNTVTPQLLTDQRGPGFDRAASANGSGARIPDMGAVEVQPPTVLIITPAIPGPTNSNSVNFTVYFNQPVNNLIDTNFQPTATGTINANNIFVGTPLGITTPLTPTSPFFSWNVPLSSISGDGTVSLSMTNSAGANPTPILGVPFNPLTNNPTNPQTGQQYQPSIVIDQTRPTLTSISTTPPVNPPPVPSGSVTFTLTFNERVVGVSASNLQFVTTGSAATTGVPTIVPVSPLADGSSATWTVTTNFTGNGTIGLNVTSPNGITDRAGNALTGTFPRVGSVYVVGNPIVTSITPTVPSTNQTSADFVVTFDQTVSGVTMNNFTLTTTNLTSATITNVTPTTGAHLQYTVTVAFGSLVTAGQDGSVTVTMSNGAGTSPVVSDLPFTGTPILVDFTAPTLQSITEATPLTPQGATNATTVDFLLTFSEPMVTPPTTDLNLTGSLAGTAGVAIGTITPTGANGYTVHVSVPANVDGTLGLNVVSAAGLTDIAGNTLTGIPPTAVGPVYSVDTTPPTVTGIAFPSSAPNPTNAPSHQLPFLVTFSEPVFGLSAGNFAVTETGSGYNGTGVVSAAPTGDPKVFLVTIDTGLEEGALGVKLNTSTGLADKGGSAVTNVGVAGPTYTVDTIPPAVTSFVPTGPTDTNAAAVGYTITFREPVVGLSVGNFTLTTDPTVSGAQITGLTPVSASTYTLTVGTGTGDGNLNLSLSNSSGLSDPLGNAAPVPVAAPVVQVDKTQPLVASIVQLDPPVTHTATVHYRVHFTEPVTGVVPANFSLKTTGLNGSNIPPTAVAPSPGSTGADYDITVVTGTGTGTLELDLSNPAGIIDAAGNPLTQPATGPVYSIDLVAPTVVSIVPQQAVSNGASVRFAVTFKEPVTGVTAGNFTVATKGPTGAAVVGTPTPNADGSVWTVDVSTGTGDGTLQLNLTSAGAIQDAAGNTLVGVPVIGQPVTVDKTAPAASIVLAPSQPNPAFGTPIRLTVNFNEPVFGFGSGGLVFGGTAGTAIATVTGASGGTTYSVSVTGLSNSGTLTASVLPGAATDAAGNPSTPSSPVSVNFNRPVPTVPDTYSTKAKQPISVPASAGVLVNDGDAISPARSASLVTPTTPDVGTVTLAPDGSFTFVPAPGFSGDAVFTYTATDGVGISAPTAVTIHVGSHTVFTATAAGAGGGPQVTVLDDKGQVVRVFYAYDPSFTGGVQVAAGDVTGDAVDDIVVGTGVGGGPAVVVFDGVTGAQVTSFFAYEPSFRGGVQVTLGDVNGDGFADIITGTGVTGGPRIVVFSGKDRSILANFFAFDESFRGGVNVSAGDTDGDGRAEILASPVAGGGPNVVVFKSSDGRNFVVARSFFAFDPSYTGGVSVAVGDAFGDGVPDIITASSTGNAVLVYNAVTGAPEATITVADPQPTGGLRLATKDTNNDARPDLLLMATGPGDMPRVERFDLTTMTRIDELIDFPQNFLGGIYVG